MMRLFDVAPVSFALPMIIIIGVILISIGIIVLGVLLAFKKGKGAKEAKEAKDQEKN